MEVKAPDTKLFIGKLRDLISQEIDHSQLSVTPKNAWARAVLKRAYGDDFVITNQFWDDLYSNEADPKLVNAILNHLVNLRNSLEQYARHQFDGYDIDFENYRANVEFDSVTALVTFTNETSGNTLSVHDIFYDDNNGKILQSVISF